MQRSFFTSRLVNGPGGDPALYVELGASGRAVLFDLGSLQNLKPAEILRIDDVFVTHAHVDHFIGFDHFLRIHVGHEKRVRMFGPPGFLEHVRGKLSGYVWNLVDGPSLEIEAVEVRDGRRVSRVFRLRDSFRAEGAERAEEIRDGILAENAACTFSCVELDHRIPCLGLAARERDRIRADTAAIEAARLAPGRWIADLKEAVARGDPPDREFAAGEGKVRLGDALGSLVKVSPGEKLAYVTDAGYSEENNLRIVRLAEGADQFYCEGGFLEEDVEKARGNCHLTARDAGELARRAGARKLTIFHFSPKYTDRWEMLESEAKASFEK
jgi:ribonuclease Z